jgi:streptogramin lyase
MKKISLIFLIFFSFQAFSQDFTDQWTGYFSYLNIKDISSGNGRIIAAAENAFFEYDPSSNTSEKIDAINGLDGEIISAMLYSENYDLTIIGYESGLLQVVMGNNGQVFTVVDIVNKLTIAPDNKRINHFFEFEDRVFISTEFGIAEYNIENLEFGDSFFIGENGTQIEVRQTTVLNSTIYAATQENSIRVANVNDPNLVDFESWQSIGNSSWRGIVTFNGNIYGVNNGNTLFEIANNNQTLVAQFPERVRRLNADENALVVTTKNSISIYDSNLNLIGFVSEIVNEDDESLEKNFSCAVILDDNLYIGDEELGLLRLDDFNASNFSAVSPDGPILNRVFSITTYEDEIWLAFGEYSQFFNPFPLNSRGVSHFTGENWSNLTFEDIDETREIADITVDINNPNRVYLSSYIDGLLILENEEVVERLDGQNSNIENTVNPAGNPIPGDTRVGGAVFNNQGDLYFSNSITEQHLKRLSGNNQVSIADLSDSFLEPFGTSSAKVATDNAGNVYLATFRFGIYGYQPSTGNSGKIASDVDGVDFPEVFNPNPAITALEFDSNGRLWIGTAEGLRVCFNPQAMFDDNARLNVSPIIFLENGVPQELLFQQFITDIKVDGAGNVWISTSDSGVFQVTSTGQETLNIFNKNNSPLPSNSVISVDIRGDTGEVFFGTANGLVSYQSRITNPVDDLENVRVFPNPVKPNYNGLVTIDGLTENANVKITDITGNLVYEEFSSGGSIQWDTRAFGRHKVASGVYLVLITGEDLIETQVSKIMIIR